MLLRQINTSCIPLAAALILAFSVFTGCKKSEGGGRSENHGATWESPAIKTWELTGEAIPPIIYEPELEALPPAKAQVWGGTVSHHLLADRLTAGFLKLLTVAKWKLFL